MSTDTDNWATLPPEQQCIRDKCYHPTDTFIPFPRNAIEQSIPERFEKMVCRYPNRLAVKARHEALTYAELTQKANRIAHTILDQREAGEEPVALLLEQGAPLIAAILGVLKAGKIYVSLDPSFPQARLTGMLLEAPTVVEMAVVIAQHQVAQADPETVARLLSEVETLSEAQAQHLFADDQL